MKRSTVIAIVVIFVLTGLIVFGVIYLRQYLPKYQWYPSYSVKSSQPYGAEITLKIFEETDLFKEVVLLDKPIYEKLDTQNMNALYVFIGGWAFYDSVTADHIMNFIREGNDAFIAIEELPFPLRDYLLNTSDSLFTFDSRHDSIITTHFRDPTITDEFIFHFQSFKRKVDYDWKCVYQEETDDSLLALSPDIISTIDSGGINCWKVDYGMGDLYIHLNPILFTNYYLIEEKGYSYLNTMLGIIGKHEVCYWDEYSKIWMFDSMGRPQFHESPLKFLLSQRSLRWAYYLTIVFILTYILFRAKRTQRPIPIMPENKNTSVEFAKAVGTLHYQTSNHTVLAKQMMNLFLSFVRQRYNIPTTLEQEDLTKQIVRKSEIPQKSIDEIFKVHFRIKYNPDPDKKDTIILHSLLENFYKNCK